MQRNPVGQILHDRAKNMRLAVCVESHDCLSFVSFPLEREQTSLLYSRLLPLSRERERADIFIFRVL
jgi:hypothetical protein